MTAARLGRSLALPVGRSTLAEDGVGAARRRGGVALRFLFGGDEVGEERGVFVRDGIDVEREGQREERPNRP